MLDGKLLLIFNEAMARRFRYARLKMKLTQGRLAELLGVSQKTLSQIETGRTLVPNVSYQRFRSIMGKHLPYIIWDTGQENYEPISARSKIKTK